LKSVAFGQGSVSGQIFPKDYFAYDESLGTPYPYDPDKAKQLLTEAGYPNGFSVDAALPATSQAVAEAMAAQLAEVGVKVNLKVLEPAQFAPEFFGGKVPAGIYTWTGRADPRQTMEALYSGTGFANPGQATTPEFTEAFNAAKVPQTDPTVEQDNIRKAARVVMEQAMAVPVYQYFNLNAFNDQVVGMDTGVLSFTQLANLGMKAKG